MGPEVIAAIIGGFFLLLSVLVPLAIASRTKKRLDAFEEEQKRKQLAFESELRLGEADRTRLRALIEPERMKAAHGFAWKGHALLKWIEQTGVVTRLAHQPTYERHRQDLERTSEDFAEFLASNGYLVTAEDRARLQAVAKAGREALLVLMARPPSATTDDLKHSEPLMNQVMELEINDYRRGLDEVCRRLSGADLAEPSREPKALPPAATKPWLTEGAKPKAITAKAGDGPSAAEQGQ